MSPSPPAPITRLNPDVLREIFRRLSKYELLDVTCVCREWGPVAQRLIDQSLELVVSTKMQHANLNLVGRLQQDPGLRHRVKDVAVKEWHSDDLPPMPKILGQIEDPWKPGRYFSTTYVDKTEMCLESKELVTQLCRALALMDLASFTWSALFPMPFVLVEVLASRPSCAVHIRRNERAYDAAVCSYSPTLNHVQIANMTSLCPQLTTLDLLLPPEDPLILSALGILIAASPRLKCLKLYALGKLYGGFKVHIPRTRPARGTVFSPVRTMEWLQRPLLSSGHRLHLEVLEMDNFCICGTQDFTLDTITDVSGVRKVGLSCFGLWRSHVQAFNLRCFRLHCHSPAANEDRYCLKSWRSSEVREMLSRCPYLTEIVLLDGAEILDRPLLERIGTKLIALSLHEVIWSQLTTAYDVDLVRKTCPRLRCLALDMPNPQAFPRFCAGLTTMFPNLEELTVSQIYEDFLFVDHYTPDPHLYSATLSDLRAIWKKMCTPESNLLKLTAHFGLWKAWDRDVHFFMCGRPYAAQSLIGFRSYVAQVALPTRMAVDEQLMNVECLEIEEAHRAVRHRQQWPDGYFREFSSWNELLDGMEEIVVRGLYLVRRLTPNAEGEFTQTVMI